MGWARIIRSARNINPPVYRIVLVQLGVTLVLAAATFGIIGNYEAVSVLLGGLVCSASNGLFVWLYFYRAVKGKGPQQQAAQVILRTAYWGELSKLLLTTSLFVLVLIVFEELNFLLFFAAYIAAQLVFWIAPLLIKR